MACTPASSSATVPEPAGRVCAFSSSSSKRSSNVFTDPRLPGCRCRVTSTDAKKIDHEDECAAGQLMSSTGRAVGEVGRADQLAATADLHPGDALLPAGDQAAQREVDRLATAPGGVELFAGFEVDAQV